jgi:hypothetical protein
MKMRQHHRILILFLGLMLIPGLCFAEFYKYRDANGVLRFTDNLAEVPENQRQNIQEYQEAVTPEATGGPVEKVQTLDLNARADQLNAERDLLAKEYAELEKERENLDKTTRDPQNDADFEAYKTQVDSYNNRIKAYEEKRKLFQTKVDAFNEDAKNQ